VTVPPEKLARVNGIDDIESIPEARSLESVHDVNEYLRNVGALDPGESMTPEAIMQAHASNLIAWVENDYNPEVLHSSLSFPLLKALIDAGDAKARRVLEGEADQRAIEGSSATRVAMIESGMLPLLGKRGFNAILQDKNIAVRVALSDKSRSPEVLAMLASDISPYIRAGVALNESTPPDVLARLARDADRDVRFNVAVNRFTPRRMLLELAKDKMKDIRNIAITNPSFPIAVLPIFAKDSDWEVRLSVADNPSSPSSLLADLARDESLYVRRGVAINSSTSTDVLEYLSDDKEKSVRESVATNRNTSPRAVAKLARDAEYIVRFAATTLRKTFVKQGL
jgi:hypothetical protein